MLRCMQSSEDDNHSSNTSFDLSMLERQRLMFQQQQMQHCLQPNINVDVVHQCVMPSLNNVNWPAPVKIDPCFHEDLPDFSGYGDEHFSLASSVTNSSFAATHKVENRGAPKRKRKAEFEGEKECVGKKIEGEAGESQSEITVKSEARESSKENSKASEVKKPDYIHVRARRGQATDSHSLAERARREKISKKMRCLQDLVPGCNKIAGKAGMLDEIINYVQSLQKQVEFLSMKLGALNPRLDFNVDHFFAKEISAYIASFPTATASIEMTNSNYFQLNSLQQGASSSVVNIVTNGTQMIPQRRDMASSISTPEVYIDSSCVPQVQQLPTWDTEWQNLYDVNFHQG